MNFSLQILSKTKSLCSYIETGAYWGVYPANDAFEFLEFLTPAICLLCAILKIHLAQYPDQEKKHLVIVVF